MSFSITAISKYRYVWVFALLAALLLWPVTRASAQEDQPTTPQVHSHYAVLIDAASGKVLWARNADVKRSIASTTKIMTAILLLEHGQPGAIVTAPPGVDKIEESSLHLKPGEQIPLHDLLYAMLLRSANDTAVAGATYLGGSLPGFAAMMNAKAAEIGTTNTHFVTPNGLYAKDHYSSAADMAKIARYAVLNLPEFNKIVRTQRYRVTRSMDKNDLWVKNTASKFLKEFPGADGIKTGYIHQAGHCFVGSATRKNWRLIAVALNSNQCREDVESLLNYGFANYRSVVAVPKGVAVGTVTVPNAAAPVPVQTAADITTAVSRWKALPKFSTMVTPLAALPQAPVAAGTKVGTVSVMIEGKVQATGDAVTVNAVALKPVLAVLKTTKHLGMGLLRIVGIVMIGLVSAGIGMRLYGRATAKSIGKRRNRVAPSVRGVD